jgi:hypothetical protein
VKYTLEPLCYSPGPADGAEEDDWRVRHADELLKLKVLDPAMGSGAFLVSACRYLGDRLVEAWERDGYPDTVATALGPDFDRDDAALEARRRIAARCLCGVDRDDAAVELGKLSLWLVTLAKDQPFSFLDHALRCGDSLVGLTSEAQVEAFHLDPERGRMINARMSGAIDEIAGPILTRVRELREEIEAEPVRDPHQGHVLMDKLAETEQLTERLRTLADGVAAAALSTAGQSAEAFDDRLTGLSHKAQLLLTTDDTESVMEAAFRVQIEPSLKGPRTEPIRPLHWPLEFPEVMDRGGFDAVVSNPPFIGGKKISGALGTDFREYLKQHVARDKSGNADLCSYFLLRDLSIARRGRIGIIATNTIAQGDTREVGLDQAVDMYWDIYRAEKSQPWPGTASLEVSMVWTGHAGECELRVLDGSQVSCITPSLDPRARVSGNPYRLRANEGQSFQGSIVLGSGFLMEPKEAQALMQQDGCNGRVLFPYLNGEDLSSRWDCVASRWVINFGLMTEPEARQFPDCWGYAESHVLREREQLSAKAYPGLLDRWWQYWRPRAEMTNAIAGLDRVLVFAQTTRTQMPLLVPARQVLSHMLVVIATGDTGRLAFHSSDFQFWWTVSYGSTLETRLRYIPSDCFETLARPRSTPRLEQAGAELDTFRRGVMERRRIGLTPLYNLVHDPAAIDEDVDRLRRVHQEIDLAVAEAYALDEEREAAIAESEDRMALGRLPRWREIELAHGFHETRQGLRFTVSPDARTDMLDKLLALNHYRHEQEVEQGLLSERRSRRHRPAVTAGDPFDEGGLFQPEGTLF